MSRDPRYQHLLNSKRWAEVKRQVWVRAGGQCERCKREGYVTAGVDCHHIKPVESAKTEEDMRQLAYDANNIELLCVACHIKTHQEMRSHRGSTRTMRRTRAMMKAQRVGINDVNGLLTKC